MKFIRELPVNTRFDEVLEIYERGNKIAISYLDF